MASKGKLVGWSLVVLAMVAATWLGVSYPMPAPPINEAGLAESRSVGQPVKWNRDVRFERAVAMDQTLAVTGVSTLTGALAANGGITVDTTNFTVSGSSGNTSIAGTLGVTGASSLTGPVTLGGALINSSTSITPTAGQQITPGYGFYTVNSSGAVSMTLAACTVAGQMVWFYGDDANTVTVNDSNLLSTDGNAVTFGQYDLVGLVCNGAAWAHAYKSANQ